MEFIAINLDNFHKNPKFKKGDGGNAENNKQSNIKRETA